MYTKEKIQVTHQMNMHTSVIKLIHMYVHTIELTAKMTTVTKSTLIMRVKRC